MSIADQLNRSYARALRGAPSDQLVESMQNTAKELERRGFTVILVVSKDGVRIG